jgi:hypothetical protein
MHAGLDLQEHPLAVIDQVHLGHRHRDVADPEQSHDGQVPARLGRGALAGVDHEHGAVGVGGGGGHVARVLLVTRGVGHDERPPRRREEAVSDIDGDALLALGLEAIDEQGEVDVLTGRAVLAAVALQRRQLILENELRIVEKAADERRLAVIDRAAGEEAQQPLFGAAAAAGTHGHLVVRVSGHRPASIRSSPRAFSSPSMPPRRCR